MRILKMMLLAAALVGFASCKSKEPAPTPAPDYGTYETGK